MAHVINFLSPEFHADPYPHYVELRKNNPVCQVDPGGMWFVARYDDVQHVFRHPEIFSSSGFRAVWLPPWLKGNPLAESILLMDPPEHTKYRNLINRVFGGNLAARMELEVRNIAESLASQIEAETETEFVSAFSFALPSIVIARMLGMDERRHKELGHWIHVLTEISPATPESLWESTKATLTDMSEYLYGFVKSRRKAPTGDFVTSLIRAEIDGMNLSDREIVSFLVLLVAAAIETTGHLISNALRFLTTAPEITARLRAEPGIIVQFLEEILRWDGPGQGVPRITMRESEIRGITIPAHAMVYVGVASANRDESRFPNGDKFELFRNVQGSLMFGHGVHHCVGSAIARLEARVALEVLLKRFGEVERASREIEWNTSIITRGPLKLPVRFFQA